MTHYKKLSDEFELVEINLLEASESDLEKISKERILGLSLNEMKMVQKHFSDEGRNPTDVELEAFAQS